MAKKTSFNMSREIRELLEQNPDMTGPDVYKALKKKNPRRAINRGSMGVAFTNARQKLGISVPKKSAKKRGKGVVRRVARPSSDNISLSALRSARELLAATGGDISTATAILKEMKALQG